jgi:histidyl-tRNA synthetase
MRANTASISAGQCDVYLVHQGDAAQLQAFILGERLRDAGLDVVLHCAALGGAGSFKSQMKRADSSGAAYALILGDDEMAKGEATIKHLREADMTNNQRHIGFDQVVDYLIDQIVGDAEHEHGHLHAGQIPTHH